jgi:peroxiredoxin
MKRLIVAVLAVAALAFRLPLFAVETGGKAPNFTLSDSTGKTHSLSDYKGKIVVLEWTNPGCPFVKKHYNTNNMQMLQKTYTGKGVIWFSMASSAKGKEGYLTADEWNKRISDSVSSPTAVLLDESGSVGKKYGAKTTPHMFIINGEGKLVYQGAIDDKPTYEKDDVPLAKNYVKAALDEMLAGKPVTTATTESYGCSVKYK